MQRLIPSRLIAAAAFLFGVSTAQASPALHLQTLSGKPIPLANHGGRILLFWRADCAPCLLELSDLRGLRAAAGQTPLDPVGLQKEELLRPRLQNLRLSDADTLTTRDDPAALLIRLGGAPPRLPLAVAFDARGEVCAKHTGLLGRNLVQAWSRSCGAAHAQR